MRATEVFVRQLEIVHAIFGRLVGRVPAAAWTVRPHAAINPIGFTLWHAAATQDWTFHTAILGQPGLRQRPPWAEQGDLSPDQPPFGMAADAADAIARAATPAALRDYQAQVHAAMGAWLATRDDAELDGVPDVLAHAQGVPAAWHTEGYWEEAHDMVGWTVARHFTSPCIGHLRGHFGEIDTVLALLRAD